MPLTDQSFKLGLFAATLTSGGHLVIAIRKRTLVDAPVSEIASVQATTGMSDRYKCKIVYRKNGAAKRAPTLSARGEDPQMFAFLAALRRMLPTGVPFDDQITPDMHDLAAARTYPVGGRLLGFTQERWGVLMFWWIMSFTIVALPFAIIATRRYRLYTNGGGLRIARFGVIEVPWSEVRGYRVVTIEREANFTKLSSMLRFTIESARKRFTFPLTGIAGTKFLAELKARGVPAL
jgi:hypothetical protein